MTRPQRIICGMGHHPGVTVAVLSEKGGVGKTTLAVHIASDLAGARQGSNWEPLKLLMVDADPQQSLTRWAAEAVEEVPVERVSNEEEMFDSLPQWQNSYQFTVIDVGGGDTAVSRAALFGVDCAVIPCGPTTLDLVATQRTLKLVELAHRTRNMGLPRVVLCPFKWQRTTLAREVLDELQQMRDHYHYIAEVMPPVPQRVGLADAPTAGSVVWQTEGGELGELMRTVCRRIQGTAYTCNEWHQTPDGYNDRSDIPGG